MFKLALKLAHRSNCRAKHGCIILKGKRILGRGFNVYKSNPTWGVKKPFAKYGVEFFSIHAEAAAIKDALRKGSDIRGATLIVVRTEMRISKPCQHCQNLIESHGISKVIYSDGESLKCYYI